MVTTIRVLMKAGAYTKSLRQAHEAGVDITGAGTLGLLGPPVVRVCLFLGERVPLLK